MMRILVSACLLGEPVRYDGRSNESRVSEFRSTLRRWQEAGLLIAVCPELLGGLPTPRPAAEITGGNGQSVLDQRARVIACDGTDVTAEFMDGANKALRVARDHGATHALLAARSPSCGSDSTYNGDFSGQLTNYQGVTAALLTQQGIPCFPPERFEELKQLVDQRTR